VATLHDYFSACPNGGFFNYQSQANCALVPLSAACISTHCDARSYPQKLWRVGRQVVQRSAGMYPGRMQHFISISDLSEAILKRYLPQNARLHRVRNPIDVPYGERAAVQDHEGFVCVGRLSPEKGGMLLAKACNSLGVRVTFVGEGPMRDAILAAAPAARVTGWLTADLVRDQIRHCRALVLPSLWYEAQPLVVSEAAAVGVPVIVADNCAAREAVVDGVTGFWFRSGDAEDLKDKLSRLHNDPGLAAAMGKAAFENYWREPPTLQRHVSELELVYARVLADT
jgi:glycosyltransferase involved in cell wall biosynthesis